MRILHILDHSVPVHSGYSFRTLAILREQHRLGWETAQLTGSKQGSERDGTELYDELTFHRTGSRGGLGARLPVANQLAVISGLERRIRQVVETWRPDILHAHSPALNGIAALRVGRKLRLPVIYEVRAFWEDAAVDLGTTRAGSVRYRLTRGLETHVLRRASAVTTICEGLKNEIVSRGIDRAAVTVIPNAVDLKRFEVAASQNVLPAGLESRLRGKSVLGFIGSFYAYEGLDLLLRSLPMILTHVPQAHVLLVGGGPQENSLKALTDELGLGHAVTFTGRVPPDTVPAYYQAADILVYPRHAIRLTELVTPLKPLEAMAYGRPVVASDIGGHRELIRSGGNGVLFEPESENSLAETLCNLLDDAGRRDSIIESGKAFVREERNWPASVARYEQVYSLALGERRAAA